MTERTERTKWALIGLFCLFGHFRSFSRIMAIAHSSQKHPTLERIIELEKRVPRAIVRIEKKLIDFPFRRYFMGHRKPQSPKYKPYWRQWPNVRLTLACHAHATVRLKIYGPC